MQKPDTFKWFSKKNIFNIVFGLVLLVLIFVPSAKALLLRGIMKIGFFNPDVSETVKENTSTGNVSFRDKNGRHVDLASLKGKVIFINFWATWCPPCIAELPSIDDLHSKLKGYKNIIFIIADADGNFAKSLPFVAWHGYGLPVYVADGPVPQSLLGNAIPATVVIDKQGKIVFRHDGATDYAGTRFQKFLTGLAAE